MDSCLIIQSPHLRVSSGWWPGLRSQSVLICCQDVLAPPAQSGQCPGLRGGDDRAQAEHLPPVWQGCHPPGGEWRHVHNCLLTWTLLRTGRRVSLLWCTLGWPPPGWTWTPVAWWPSSCGSSSRGETTGWPGTRTTMTRSRCWGKNMIRLFFTKLQNQSMFLNIQ